MHIFQIFTMVPRGMHLERSQCIKCFLMRAFQAIITRDSFGHPASFMILLKLFHEFQEDSSTAWEPYIEGKT